MSYLEYVKQRINDISQVGDVITIAQLDERYTLVSIDYEIESVCASIGVSSEEYGTLFVLVGNAEYSQVWGMWGLVPYLNRRIERIY